MQPYNNPNNDTSKDVKNTKVSFLENEVTIPVVSTKVKTKWIIAIVVIIILLLIGASGGFGIFVVPPIWRMDVTDGVQCPMVEGEIVNTSTIEYCPFGSGICYEETVVKVKQEDNTTKTVYLPMGLKNNFLNGSRFSQPVCQYPGQSCKANPSEAQTGYPSTICRSHQNPRHRST